MNRIAIPLLILYLVMLIITLTGCQKVGMIVYEEPVCGANHITYSSAYFAERAGVDSIQGKCLKPASDCGCSK